MSLIPLSGRAGRDQAASAELAASPLGPSPVIPSAVLRRLNSEIGAFAARVARRIQAEVVGYAGADTGGRQRLITLAISRAAYLFVARLDRPAGTTGVDELFAKMGYGEASEDHTLDAFRAALRIAGREGWESLRYVVESAGLPATTLGWLGSELAMFMDHLSERVAAGHALAMRQRLPQVSRERLVEALLAGDDLDSAAEFAWQAGWTWPTETVVIAAEGPKRVQWPGTDRLGKQVLSRVEGTTAVFIGAAERKEALIDQLGATSRVKLAHCTVLIDQVPTAARWTRRTLELVERGVLPAKPVIDCRDHRIQLWLHSEELLRSELAREMLGPLQPEIPKSRYVLGQTLLTYLEQPKTNGGPSVAKVLGVHIQTVYYRLRKLHQLFGESLSDPETVTQLTMVLKASVPLWKAGDVSDFEQ